MCPDVWRALYYSFIRSRILYGVEIYANTFKSFLKGLVLNNKILYVFFNISHTERMLLNYIKITIL